MWIIQLFAKSQPDPSSQHHSVLQGIAQSAGDIFSARNQSEALSAEVFTGILSHVDGDWQMYTFNKLLELERPPTSLWRNFLDDARESPEALLDQTTH
jgi:hypothetical protein